MSLFPVNAHRDSKLKADVYVRRNPNICEVADKVLIPLKSSKFWYFFLVIFFFLGGSVGKALIWSKRLFNIFKLKGRGQTRSGGGGGVSENSLDSSIYVVCYVNVLHLLNDFSL